MSEILNAMEYKAKLCRENGKSVYADEYEAIADHIRDLEAQLARVRELPGKLPEKWRVNNEVAPSAYYEGYSDARHDCADELEAALQSAEGKDCNQPKVDNPKSEG